MESILQFKTKIKRVYNMNDTLAYKYINIPIFTKKHCNMRTFENNPDFSGYTNSNMFENILNAARTILFEKDWCKIAELPDCVTIDASKMLAVVTIKLKTWR